RGSCGGGGSAGVRGCIPNESAAARARLRSGDRFRVAVDAAAGTVSLSDPLLVSSTVLSPSDFAVSLRPPNVSIKYVGASAKPFANGDSVCLPFVLTARKTEITFAILFEAPDDDRYATP